MRRQVRQGGAEGGSGNEGPGCGGGPRAGGMKKKFLTFSDVTGKTVWVLFGGKAEIN